MADFTPREFLPDHELEAEYIELLAHSKPLIERERKQAKSVSRSQLFKKTRGKLGVALCFSPLVAGSILGGISGYNDASEQQTRVSAAYANVYSEKQEVTDAQTNLAKVRASLGSACVKSLDMILGDRSMEALVDGTRTPCGETTQHTTSSMDQLTSAMDNLIVQQGQVPTAEEAYDLAQQDKENPFVSTFGSAIIGGVIGFAGTVVISGCFPIATFNRLSRIDRRIP